MPLKNQKSNNQFKLLIILATTSSLMILVGAFVEPPIARLVNAGIAGNSILIAAIAQSLGVKKK